MNNETERQAEEEMQIEKDDENALNGLTHPERQTSNLNRNYFCFYLKGAVHRSATRKTKKIQCARNKKKPTSNVVPRKSQLYHYCLKSC